VDALTEVPAVDYVGPMRARQENVIAATTLHDQTAEVLCRVADGDEEIVVTEGGKPVAAIVPIRKLEMIRRIEDRVDAEDARAAREEVSRLGTVPNDDVKARLGL
jgi:prevent-host-death family protein